MQRLSIPRDRGPFFVGVVHLPPTPGSPRYGGSMQELLARAVEDARRLVGGGVDALIVENFGDTPFFAGSVPSETVASLTAAVLEVRREAAGVPVGVNVLRNDVRAGLGICSSTGALFVRVNVHTGAMVTDQGLIEGRAAETLRERERLCPGVSIVADVHVKHARPLTDETLEEAARDAVERGGADVLVVSGARTGAAPDPGELARLREALPETPLWIGSGLDLDNAHALLSATQGPRPGSGPGGLGGAIVGTSLKEGGLVSAPVDARRVERLRQVFDTLAGPGPA